MERQDERTEKKLKNEPERNLNREFTEDKRQNVSRKMVAHTGLPFLLSVGLPLTEQGGSPVRTASLFT